jgi:hypothetical protein
VAALETGWISLQKQLTLNGYSKSDIQLEDSVITSTKIYGLVHFGILTALLWPALLQEPTVTCHNTNFTYHWNMSPHKFHMSGYGNSLDTFIRHTYLWGCNFGFHLTKRLPNETCVFSHHTKLALNGTSIEH